MEDGIVNVAGGGGVVSKLFYMYVIERERRQTVRVDVTRRGDVAAWMAVCMTQHRRGPFFNMLVVHRTRRKGRRPSR